MKAMILAAGRGERMRPLTDHTPKPLLRIGDKALIAYHLEALARGGFDEVVINVAHLSGQIRNALGDGQAWGLRIRYSDEGREALETGGGILHALPLLGDGPFLVVNGDIYCDCPLRPRALAPGDLAHLVLVDNPPHHPKGDFALDAGRLRNQGGRRLTFAGIGYYRAGLFSDCRPGKFPLAPLLRAAADGDRISAEHQLGVWSDIGTPQRLEALDSTLSAQAPPP
jgi:MurNAc alpha-1-phosphate uridylyltransferase